ncbi:MAG: hypothetical protein OHK93_002130 [Ramalina farinacea]|uniref:Uncharacterized protein n=1 Tax=Ramalina farinacea TaxID=258253 RepID=A0AA43QV76_9LECA|nr:hypothetical protein [Ramalina farinacea]
MILRLITNNLLPSCRTVPAPLAARSRDSFRIAPPTRLFSSNQPFFKSTADEKIEEITELYSPQGYKPYSDSSYATAKDEFEIASEETDKKTVYAADDRAAAEEELVKLKTAYDTAIRGEGGEEIQRRIGGRMRELEMAVKAMNERAMED